MTNGAMNVEIGNPAYKIYEGDPDDDAGELLDSDFALDPDKVTRPKAPLDKSDVRYLSTKLQRRQQILLFRVELGTKCAQAEILQSPGLFSYLSLTFFYSLSSLVVDY